MSSAQRAASVALVLATATVLAGCAKEAAVNREPHAGTATATPKDGVQEVHVKAPTNYRFDPSTIVVHPGRVRVILTNTGKGAPHNWSLLGFPAAFVPLASAGATKQAEFDAPAPGTYTFVCTIHVKQGQTGKLVVLPN